MSAVFLSKHGLQPEVPYITDYSGFCIQKEDESVGLLIESALAHRASTRVFHLPG